MDVGPGDLLDQCSSERGRQALFQPFQNILSPPSSAPGSFLLSGSSLSDLLLFIPICVSLVGNSEVSSREAWPGLTFIL